MSQDEPKRIRKKIKALEKALELKPLKGSIVPEMVRCNKPGCHSCPHGPYNYLHYYDAASGKVKRKYLGKATLHAIQTSRRDLIRQIRELKEKQILGQQEGPILHPRDRGPNRCSDPFRTGCKGKPHTSIYFKDQAFPVCKGCWIRIAESDISW